MLRYLSSGESHGKVVTAIMEGVPSGLAVLAEGIDSELARRQSGYGRGARMRIESDRVKLLSGIRDGRTLGSPITLAVENLDWENWKEVMASGPLGRSASGVAVTRPRPGHADLAGGLKYGLRDLRNVLERSSARETAARVAVGAVAKSLLLDVGIDVYSWVVEIGGVKYNPSAALGATALFKKAEASSVRCPDKAASLKMKRLIKRAKENGDSLGGVFSVVVRGVPPGLGSHVQWDRKLDGKLSMALMSVQAIKGVEVGLGFGAGSAPGSKVHDEIFYRAGRKSGSKAPTFWPLEKRFYRKTNNAGGIEGGMSNGEDIILKAVMKPIPTLYKPLRSVDIETKKPFRASVERSDTCAVPAAAVVGEAAVAFEIAAAFLEKFGGDSMREVKRNYKGFLKQVKDF
jgi:chorismate synthase